MAITLPITLATTGAAAILNVWIATRVGGARRASKVSVGDGGDPALTARMRAHANFVEYTPFMLVLIAVIELNIGSPNWLMALAALYLIARIAHPFGMDGAMPARMFGTIVTLLLLLGLGIYAIVLPFTAAGTPQPTPIDLPPAKG